MTASPVAAESVRQDPTAFATVIDTSAAPTGVETLADALSDAVGVQVRRFGGLGDFSTLSVRGFAAGQVQVYLDGVPLSRADNETVNLSDLPLDAVERVEVYRGTTPLAFAQSGPGGVVNVVTRRPTGTPVTAASASGGSFDTRKADLVHTGTAGAWDWLAFAHYLGSAGDFAFTNDLGTPSPADDRIETRRNNAFNLGDLTARLGWRPTAPLALALTSDTFVKQEGVPGAGTVQTRDTSLRTLRQLTHLDARLGPASGLPFDVDASAYVVHQRQAFTASANDAPFVAAHTDERSTAEGVQALARGAVGAHHVPGLLVAAGHERFTFSDRTSPSGPEPARSRVRGTVAAEDEILLLGTRVSLVPGVRWEIFRDDFPGVPAAHQAGAPAGGVHGRDFVSPHLGVRADAGHGLTLLGNLGRYAREPNLQELFGNRGVVIGNPTLRPEVAFNRDVGFRWLAPARGPLGDAALEYAYFDNQIDDLIALQQTTASVSKPVNVDAAHVTGHEVDARLRLWRRVGLVGNYTHQSAIDEGQIPSTRGKRIPGRPGEEAYVRVDLAWSPAAPLPVGPVGARLWPGRLFYEANIVGDDFLDKANTARRHVASRTYHGVGIDLALTLAQLHLAVEVKNAGDDLTRDAFAFPLPGRTFFATLSYGFGTRAEKAP